MKTVGSYLLDNILISHFSINQGVHTSENFVKTCDYRNCSLVNTATCSKMNRDKHTEEEEQSKQKHAVTLWHDIRKKPSKVITFWLISDPATKSERNFYFQKTRKQTKNR